MRIPSRVLPAMLLLLALAAPLAAQGTGTLKVTSSYDGRTYCGASLQAALLLLQPARGGDPIAFRTDLTGAATVKAPAGDYHVQLADTLLVAGGCLTWHVPVRIEPGRTLEVALTNANASLLRPYTDTTPPDTAAAAAAARRWRGELMAVSAGMRLGTGVLVDAGGLVLTSAWVVQSDSIVVVEADHVTRRQARVVIRDPGLGIAVVHVDPAVVGTRTPVPLDGAATAAPGAFINVVFQRPGSAALAVWTPVEDTATGTMRVDLPDAHLASGGLVVTASGEPVALVTAGRYEQCAPPVPNALPITRARPLVDAARARLASLPPPDATPLLPWPADSFTAAMLDSIADVAPLDRYEGLDELKAGHFKVRLTTPPLLLVESRAWNAQRRKNVEKWTKGAKGEEKACWEKVPRPPERERATSAAVAAVAIHVNAQLTMTGGEKLYGITVAKPFIRMEGDLGGAVIYRNGEPVAPIVGGTDWRTHRLYTPKGQWADSAHIGWYLLPGTVLAPDPNGAPPTIALYLPDLRHPNEPSCLELRPDKVALLWNDFVPAYAKASPPPVRADPKAKPQTPRPAPGQACPVRSNRPF